MISTILLAAFGPRAMWLHMVTIPASQPWREAGAGFFSRTGALLWALAIFVADCDEAIALPLGPTLILLAAGLLRGRDSRAGWRVWLREKLWLVLPFNALLLIPASLLGFVKGGGYVNNF